MPTAHTPAHPLPRWLRTVIWLGLLALAVVTVAVVTCRVVLHRQHRRVEEIRARLAGKTARVSAVDGASGPSAGPAATGEKRRATRIRDLPEIGLFFTDLAAAEASFSELRHLMAALDTLAHRPDSLVDFRKALRMLGLPVPEVMTPQEAAAAFLEATRGAAAELARVEAALKIGPWDWGISPLSRRRPEAEKAPVDRLLSAAWRQEALMLQAAVRVGDHASVAARIDGLAHLVERRADMGTMEAGRAHTSAAGLYRSQGLLEAMAPGDLAHLRESLAPFDVAAVFQRTLESEITGWEDVKSRSADLDQLAVIRLRSRKDQFGGIDPSLIARLVPNSVIADNISVMQTDLASERDRFIPGERRYLAAPTDAKSAWQTVHEDGSWLNQLYFFIAPGPDGLAGFANFAQTRTDFARLSIALEEQRRSTGQYPESLEATAGQFGGSLPHQFLSGNPYRYQRTVDGGYRLWTDRADPQEDVASQARGDLFIRAGK